MEMDIVTSALVLLCKTRCMFFSNCYQKNIPIAIRKIFYICSLFSLFTSL